MDGQNLVNGIGWEFYDLDAWNSNAEYTFVGTGSDYGCLWLWIPFGQAAVYFVL